MHGPQAKRAAYRSTDTAVLRRFCHFTSTSAAIRAAAVVVRRMTMRRVAGQDAGRQIHVKKLYVTNPGNASGGVPFDNPSLPVTSHDMPGDGLVNGFGTSSGDNYRGLTHDR